MAEEGVRIRRIGFGLFRYFIATKKSDCESSLCQSWTSMCRQVSTTPLLILYYSTTNSSTTPLLTPLLLHYLRLSDVALVDKKAKDMSRAYVSELGSVVERLVTRK